MKPWIFHVRTQQGVLVATCALARQKNHIVAAFTACSPADQPSKKRGRQIVEGRLAKLEYAGAYRRTPDGRAPAYVRNTITLDPIPDAATLTYAINLELYKRTLVPGAGRGRVSPPALAEFCKLMAEKFLAALKKEKA